MSVRSAYRFVKAIPHKDCAAGALYIFLSDCIKIPQEY